MSQKFGKFSIPDSHIFYNSPSNKSCAFVNLKPIVPGHVLVIPEREGCLRMSELTDDEYADLWQSVRVVQRNIEGSVGGSSCNVAVQDGAGAGQSVPHVHVHILPRTAGDLKEDEIYEKIEQWHPWSGERPEGAKMEMPTTRVDRTSEMMADEATEYRKLF